MPYPDPSLASTSRARAQLCDRLEPVLASLHAELHASAPKHPERPAAAQALLFAGELRRDVARLLTGDAALKYLKPLAIRDGQDQMSLLIAVAGMQAAVAAFRARYYGWHADQNGYGWRIRTGGGLTIDRFAPDPRLPKVLPDKMRDPAKHEAFQHHAWQAVINRVREVLCSPRDEWPEWFRAAWERGTADDRAVAERAARAESNAENSR